MRLVHSAAAVPAFALALVLSSTSVAQDALPEGPAKVAIQESCTQCHDLGTAVGQKRTPDEWVDIVDRMVGFGLTLTDGKRIEILDYLNAHVGTAPAQPAAGPAAQPSRKP